jgi:hypothetical protein
LAGEGTYDESSELLSDIRLMNFIDRDNIDDFFKKLKKKYYNENYKKFFSYFNRTWLDSRYPKNL